MNKNNDDELMNIEMKNLDYKKGKRKTKEQIVSQIFEKNLENQSLRAKLLNAIKEDKTAQIREAYFMLRLPKNLKLKIESYVRMAGATQPYNL